MAFNNKNEPKRAKAITLSEKEQNTLYTNTFRCPTCFKIPSVSLNLDYDSLLSVNITCKCGMEELEINDYLDIYSKDFRCNIQCKDCKVFATKKNTIYGYCLKCEKFVCGECHFDHLTIEGHTFIPFKEVGTICPEHKNYYQAYCKNCKKDICKECYKIKMHKKHKIINYNSLLLSDMEMLNINNNYTKSQLTVLSKDSETKETMQSLLKDEDKFIQNYIIELFDNNKQRNQYILKFFKQLLTLYNNSEHKTYNLIMNIRNNIGFNTFTFKIKPDSKMDSNTLLNKLYLYSKNHCIAKKPLPFKKHIIGSKMDEIYYKMIENIDLFNHFFSIKEAELKEKSIKIQIQSPFQYKDFIYFGEYIENVENSENNSKYNEYSKYSEYSKYDKYSNNGIFSEFSKYSKYSDYNKYSEYSNSENNKISDNKLIAHGRGIIIYENGNKYLGNFENGKKSKLGIYYFKNGAKYKGYWEKNKFNGYGIYYYANGTIYEGYFKDNKRNGAGVVTTSNGDIYESLWDNGNISCIGKIIYKNGEIYKGYMKNYKKDSYGIINYTNGDSFIGIIFNDLLYFGTYSRKNGERYVGYFKNNKINGYGKLKNIIKNEVYEGYFKDGVKQGIGKYFYRNGDIYKGYWFDDLRNGFGIIEYNNGDRFEGIFIKDIINGIGIYFEKNGLEYYLGEWLNNNKEGIATIYNRHWTYLGTVKNGIRAGLGFLFYDNNIYIGKFKNNKFDDGFRRKGLDIFFEGKNVSFGKFKDIIIDDFEVINDYESEGGRQRERGKERIEKYDFEASNFRTVKTEIIKQIDRPSCLRLEPKKIPNNNKFKFNIINKYLSY